MLKIKRRCRLKSTEAIFFTMLGVLTTVLDYQFGVGVQVEQFPYVFRLLDSTYLENDFFVASTTYFGPRFYYAHLIAGLSHLAQLPAVIFLLTLVVNTALVVITYFATRDLLRADMLAGFLASTLVVSVSSFPLGLAANIRFETFQPGSLAIVAALAAFWAGLKSRPILAAVLALVASIPHPLYGLETGAIALITVGITLLFRLGGEVSFANLVRAVARTAVSVVILVGSATVFWMLPYFSTGVERLSTTEIVADYAYFRAPHHYVPSLFPIEHYVSFLAFLAAAGLAWLAWHRADERPRIDLVFLAPAAIILLGCIGGYLFVEVWPSRTLMTAQLFRLLYLIKWQGLMLLGWVAATMIRDRSLLRSTLGWVTLCGTGAVHPLIVFVSLVGERVGGLMRRTVPAVPYQTITILVVLVAAVLVYEHEAWPELVHSALGLCIAFCLCSRWSLVWRQTIPILLVGIVVLVATANRTARWVDWKAITPVVTWKDHQGDVADVARWARLHTPAQALFLTPPGLGTFRVLAHRAIVVDFWSIPYIDPAMKEWRHRLRNCYGETIDVGFAALDEMDRHYGRMSDEAFLKLASRYEVNFAVVYASLETSLKVLYTNDTYKIVALYKDM